MRVIIEKNVTLQSFLSEDLGLLCHVLDILTTEVSLDIRIYFFYSLLSQIDMGLPASSDMSCWIEFKW